MSRFRFSADMIAWIEANCRGKWLHELTADFNEHFHTNLAVNTIRNALKYRKIKTDVFAVRAAEIAAPRRLTTPEQDAQVIERFHHCGDKTATDVQEYLKTLGVDMTYSQVKSYLKRTRIFLGTSRFRKGCEPPNKGKTMSPEIYAKIKDKMFQKGHRPQNYRVLGSERLLEGKYILVKVAEPDVWKMKQRVVWEQATGEKLTNDERIVFLDSDTLNCDIDNLAKVTRSQLIRLNQNYLHSTIPELTKVGITFAKLIEAKHKKKSR